MLQHYYVDYKGRFPRLFYVLDVPLLHTLPLFPSRSLLLLLLMLTQFKHGNLIASYLNVTDLNLRMEIYLRSCEFYNIQGHITLVTPSGHGLD